MSRRVLFVFLDGVGIGLRDPDRNPLFRAELPVLRSLLGGTLPHVDEPRVAAPGAVAFPLDATLGVEGLPQSGTGQTTLLTGVNAAERFGRHFGPWVPVALRPLVEDGSVLRRAVEAGHDTIFANAYPEGWIGRGGGRFVAAPPLAARAAGLLTRHAEALRRGEAVASEIVNDGWRTRLGRTELPTPSAREAGRTLGHLASAAALTFFAHYTLDYVGHEGRMADAVAALERVDAFLGGALEALPDDALLLVASDHGNVEDVEAGHTLNPVLGLLVGPDAPPRSAELAGIGDVPQALMGWLGGSRPGGG